jgi:hypothetical protein
LHTLSGILASIDIAFRVHGENVQVKKLPGIMAEAAKLPDLLQRLPIQDSQSVIATRDI